MIYRKRSGSGFLLLLQGAKNPCPRTEPLSRHPVQLWLARGGAGAQLDVKMIGSLGPSLWANSSETRPAVVNHAITPGTRTELDKQRSSLNSLTARTAVLPTEASAVTRHFRSKSKPSFQHPEWHGAP
jgi:hypothetical protein